MAKGLVYIWIGVLTALTTLYLTFQFLVPILGMLDSEIQKIIIGGNVEMSSTWVDFYMYWVPILRNFFGYLTVACFISLLVYVIVQSARREPDEEEQIYPVE